jgi:hypothetical protein
VTHNYGYDTALVAGTVPYATKGFIAIQEAAMQPPSDQVKTRLPVGVDLETK